MFQTVKQWPVQPMSCKVRLFISRPASCKLFFLAGNLTFIEVNNAYVAALCTPVLEEILGIPSTSVFNYFLAEATNSAPSLPTINTTGGVVSSSLTSNFTLASPSGGFSPQAASFTGDAATVRMLLLDYVLGAVVWLVWIV